MLIGKYLTFLRLANFSKSVKKLSITTKTELVYGIFKWQKPFFRFFVKSLGINKSKYSKPCKTKFIKCGSMIITVFSHESLSNISFKIKESDKTGECHASADFEVS